MSENALFESYQRSKIVIKRSDSYNECWKFLASPRTQTFIDLNDHRTLSNIPAIVKHNFPENLRTVITLR